LFPCPSYFYFADQSPVNNLKFNFLDILFGKEKPKPMVFQTEITINEVALPIDVHVERRHTWRFSMTHRGIYLRLPLGTTQAETAEHLARLEAWILDMARKKPTILDAFRSKNYQHGDVLTVGKRQYRLDIQKSARKTLSARRKLYTIYLALPETAPSSTALNNAIKQLLSRVIAQDFHHEILHRVFDLNDRHFKQPLEGLQLKYQSSRWGSCSAKKNINLSTRLLFAPDDVQDYVIIHELAHLIELNHSDRFWALVERAMPDYQQKEKWLREHGGKCDF
jgi:predicted metal-dependent hydrolase